MTSCIADEVLQRFAMGTASRGECREVVRHLLASCGKCAGRLRSDVQPPSDEGAYDVALARTNALVQRVLPQATGGDPIQSVSPW